MSKDHLTPARILKEFKENGYESEYSSSKTLGVRQPMTDYLKANGVFYSDTDNGEKWRRVVRDCVPSEQHLADPSHYKRVPKKFAYRWDFVVHHYLFPARLIHHPLFRYALAFTFTYYAHLWSFEWYVKPLWNLPPCAKIPLQPQCYALKTIQDYTFNGWNDFAKLFWLWGVQNVFKQVAEVIAPLRHR